MRIVRTIKDTFTNDIGIISLFLLIRAPNATHDARTDRSVAFLTWKRIPINSIFYRGEQIVFLYEVYAFTVSTDDWCLT